MFGDSMTRRVAGAILSAAIGASLALVACKKRNQSEIQSTKPSQNVLAVQNPQASPQVPVAACNFEWAEQKNQAGIWKDVAAAFSQELVPDEPNTNPNVTVYQIKEVARVARCGDALFIVLEKRSTQKGMEGWLGPFELYNFNRSNKGKSRITARWPFWDWKFRQLARFEDDPAPDITFESATCSNCDAASIILSSLRFDPKEQKWELRRWLQNDTGITIHDMNEEMDVGDYETLSGIDDFDGKGHDELALWTHYQEVVIENGSPKNLPPVTSVSLFSFRAGTAFGMTINDEAEVHRIKSVLCELDPEAAACKKVL